MPDERRVHGVVDAVDAAGIEAEVTRGLTRMEMGVGLRAGLAIVAVAILLDRLSRAALQRDRKTA